MGINNSKYDITLSPYDNNKTELNIFLNILKLSKKKFTDKIKNSSDKQLELFDELYNHFYSTLVDILTNEFNDYNFQNVSDSQIKLFSRYILDNHSDNLENIINNINHEINNNLNKYSYKSPNKKWNFKDNIIKSYSSSRKPYNKQAEKAFEKIWVIKDEIEKRDL